MDCDRQFGHLLAYFGKSPRVLRFYAEVGALSPRPSCSPVVAFCRVLVLLGLVVAFDCLVHTYGLEISQNNSV